MKYLKDINKINEGIRINNNYLNASSNKEYNIDDVINDLAKLQELLEFYLDKNDFLNSLDIEISDVVLELRKWKKNGWKKVKFFNKEWIPLSS